MARRSSSDMDSPASRHLSKNSRIIISRLLFVFGFLASVGYIIVRFLYLNTFKSLDFR